MKNLLTLITLLLMAVFVLTACGGGETDASSVEEPPVEEPSVDEPDAEEPAAEEPAGAEPMYDMVVVSGTHQKSLGCEANWIADCEASALSFDETSGKWVETFDLTAGNYSYVIATDGGFDISFGRDGSPGKLLNMTLILAEDAPVTFTFDPATNLTEAASEGLGDYAVIEPTPEIPIEQLVVAGTIQAQLGCEEDWMPDCEITALTKDDASGNWVGTFDLEAGAYEIQLAANGSWDMAFGKDGKSGFEANISFTLDQASPVIIAFNPDTKLTEVQSEGFAPPPAAAEEGGLVIWADTLVGPGLEASVAAFEEEFGIPVTVESMGFGVVLEQFQTAAPAGEGPDIIVAPHNVLGEYVASGLLIPIDLGDKVDDFYPATIQALTYNGDLYGMPIAIDNVALVRNTESVPQAPTTWDEVVEISREIAANNDEDIETNQYGFVLMQGDGYHFLPIQTAFDGYIFGLNENGSWNPADVGLDSPGSIAAAQWMEAYLEEGLQPRGISPDQMIDWFEAGKSAMTITGPWFLNRIRESGIPFEFSDLPTEVGQPSPFLGVGGFMVSAFSKEPLLAQIFLSEFVASEAVYQSMYDVEQRVYAYTPFMDNIDDLDLAAIAHAGLNGIAMPVIPEMNAVWSAWNNALTLIHQGTETAEGAFTTAAEQIRTALE
jgi:maltose-binding protein MalE